MNSLKVVLSFLNKVAQGQKVLYIVHPDSILEQSRHIDHVKPFLDKLRDAVSSFPGAVLVTKLESEFLNNLLKNPEQDAPEEFKQGDAYVKSFMDWIYTKARVIVETRTMDKPLGAGPMGQVLDDMFLNDQIEKIILGGCFVCDRFDMCVNGTYNALVREYGPEKVEIDPNLTMKSGLVVLPLRKSS